MKSSAANTIKPQPIIAVDVCGKLLTESTEQGQTILHITFIQRSGLRAFSWININKTICLEADTGSATNIQLPLLFAQGVPLAPEKYFFKHNEKQFQFTLLFPALPAGCSRFKLTEPGAWETPIQSTYLQPNTTGAYRITL